MNLVGRKNAYHCALCQGYTVTIDVDEGVTPMFLACRASGSVNKCSGMATSMMYPDGPWPDHVPQEPQFEWYKPSIKWARRKGSEVLDHVKSGGLMLRTVGAQQAVEGV